MNADLVCPRRGNLNLLEFEGLTRGPADGGLALDWLSGGVRHGEWARAETERRELCEALSSLRGIYIFRGRPDARFISLSIQILGCRGRTGHESLGTRNRATVPTEGGGVIT